MLKKISLIQFKNYTTAHFAFNERITCITGSNGSGKTSLLDAIYLLCYTKSYFTPWMQHCALTNTDGFRVTGNFLINNEDELISCKWRAGKKEVFHNDAPYERPADHIGKYAAVMIAPDDTELINDGSEVRRKWMDGILSQTDRTYLEKLLLYQKALQSRNAWLKAEAVKATRNTAEIEWYDNVLHDSGTYIYLKRKTFIEGFLPGYIDTYNTISSGKGTISLHYTSDLAQTNMSYLLLHSLDNDLRLQRTTKGIHKDDLVFQYDGLAARQFASQGQKKSMLFALKLAQYDYLKKAMGRTPMLLLDDVFEKLDQERMEALLQIVRKPEFGQVMLSDTHADRVRAAFATTDGLDFIAL